MKYLNRYIFFFLAFIVFLGHSQRTEAQDRVNNWQLGLGIGYSSYYGDLSNYRIHGAKELYKIYKFGNYNSYYQHQPSLSILIQKKLTPVLGIMFQANYLQFSMSDRYRKNNGSLDSSSANFSRSLNFKTTMQDLGLAFTFTPHGYEKVFFYPSFYVGAGVSKFVVKGDLYDTKNNPYNYALPGNSNDGSYETNLRDLRTETDSKFRNVEPYVDLGLALNFRINPMLSIALQSDIKYSASDYLDDVSRTYKLSYSTPTEAYAAKPGYNIVNPVTRQRGDNNGVNDFYINNRIVLNIALSRKKASTPFNSPIIYSLNKPYVGKKADSVNKRKTANADSAMLVKTDSAMHVKMDSVNKAFNDSLSRIAAMANKSNDSTVTKQLNNINNQLLYIKEMLLAQQPTSRLQQLQYQTDSIGNLKKQMRKKIPLSKENNLQLRIYDLQLDSLRNEYQNTQRKLNQPFSNTDSALLLHKLSDSMPYYNAPAVAVKTTIQGDSIQAYRIYLEKIDSIQQRLDRVEKRSAAIALTDSSDERIRTVYRTDSLRAATHKRETDSIFRQYDQELKVLRQQARASSDSATRLKALQRSSVSNVRADTVKEKTPWYERYLGIGKKKRSKAKTDTSIDMNYTNQQSVYDTNAAVANRKIEKVEDDKADVAVQRIKEARENKISIDSVEYSTNLELIKRRTQQNSTSIASLQSQLQRSKDSAAYYKQAAAEAQQTTNTKKQKWYQNLFTSKKKRENSTNAESAIIKQNSQQQQLYDDDIRNKQNRIDELQKRNSELQNSYRSYSSDRTSRQGVDFQVSPVFVPERGRSNDSKEIENLRAQLQNLQNEINYDRRQKTVIDPSNATPPMPSITINNPRPVEAQATSIGDTSGLRVLREEFNQLRNQLDSMKKTPVKIQPVPSGNKVKTSEKDDISTFPVISVYFKLGATGLSADQLNKIAPLGKMANRNIESKISLTGFTDAVGSVEKNKIIAEKRSAYIKNVLVTRYKIGDSRIEIEDAELGQSGATKKNNPLDRRVDLRFN
ncbi:MAG: OmpA family protein [Chitinophagaceae bacterium]